MHSKKWGLGPVICTLKREVSETSASVFQILATKNKTWQKHRARVGRQPSHLQCDTWTIGWFYLIGQGGISANVHTGALVGAARAQRWAGKDCGDSHDPGQPSKVRSATAGASSPCPASWCLPTPLEGGVLERRCFHQPLMQALQSSPIQDPHSHSCLSCMYLPLSAPWDHLPKMRDHPPQTSDREHLICVL